VKNTAKKNKKTAQE